nr:unnamed protein product [Callosobruchus analis]
MFKTEINFYQTNTAKYCKASKSHNILGPKVYNKLPNEVKFCTSLKYFKEKLKILLLDKCLYDVTDFVNV